MYDTQWGMPGVGWAQQGSFLDPATPPIDPPDGGTLVSLGCVNKDWVKLIVGALDQLRNPSSWLASLDDAGRAEVLNRVDKLLGMITGMDACVNPVVNVALDCTNGLQYQTADGIWHVGTNMADICTCTTGCIVSPVPPNPSGASHDQHACNLAGFLASEIIQTTMQQMEAYVGTTNEQVAFAHSLLGALAFAFPITSAVANAAYGFYQTVVSQLLSQVTDAATDPALWSDVTCAIYSAIRAVGYVDSTNFAQCATNIHGITYRYPFAVNAVGNFWSDLGLTNIQAMQNYGSMDDVDCSNCGDWCNEVDFRVNNGGFALNNPPLLGTYVAATGWEGTYYAPSNFTTFIIRNTASPIAVNCSRVDVWISCAGINSTPGARVVALYHLGAQVGTFVLPNGIISGVQKFSKVFSPALTVDQFLIQLTADGHNQVLCETFENQGHPPAPAGIVVCTR